MDGSNIQPFPTECSSNAVTQEEPDPTAKDKEQDSPATPTHDNMKEET
jgi:hypothetical protein